MPQISVNIKDIIIIEIISLLISTMGYLDIGIEGYLLLGYLWMMTALYFCVLFVLCIYPCISKREY